VPINVRVIEWDADNPPADWARVIRRWELIDVYCSCAAILAFALSPVAMLIQRPNFSMASGVTGVNRLTRLPSGSRNSSDRLPQGIVVGSLTNFVATWRMRS
jgi:hypothetical protein